MGIFKVKTRKTHMAVLTVWAALSAAAMLLPGIPTLGTGSTMSLTYPLSPIAGILFGPYAGALCTMIGSLIGSILSPANANLGIWTFTTQTLTALGAGFIARGKWQVPSLMMIPFVIWLYTLKCIQVVWWHGWIFVLAVILSIVCAKWISKFFKTTNVAKLTIAAFLVSFTSYLYGIMVSDPFGIVMYDLQPELYMILTFQMPLERLIFALFTTILAVPLLIGLPKIKIFAGPLYDDVEELEDDVDKAMAEKTGK